MFTSAFSSTTVIVNRSLAIKIHFTGKTAERQEKIAQRFLQQPISYLPKTSKYQRERMNEILTTQQ
jgi:hypothetical protein